MFNDVIDHQTYDRDCGDQFYENFEKTLFFTIWNVNNITAKIKAEAPILFPSSLEEIK